MAGYFRELNSSNMNLIEEGQIEDSVLDLTNNVPETVSLRASSNFFSRRSQKKSSCGFINATLVLQIITQQTTDQLALILGKMGLNKSKTYYYKSPEERFNQKKEYTLEKDKPTKAEEQKMLKVQQLIKTKIDNVIMFLYGILKDTSDELHSEGTFHTLENALQNIYKTQADDFAILNMKTDELCKQLFHDVKRIDKEVNRLLAENRALNIGFVSEKDRVTFLNIKKFGYVEKWENSRRSLQKFIYNREANNVRNYIHNTEDQIMKDNEVTTQITALLGLDIQELEQKRDQYPEKLERECDLRSRVISQLKEDLEKMKIDKKELKAELAKRTQEIIDWKIYKGIKEIEDAELARIAEEEELARQQEEERIAAELAAEEEYVATLTTTEKIQYFKDKKEEEKRAAKEAKKAAKAEKKKRRKA